MYWGTKSFFALLFSSFFWLASSSFPCSLIVIIATLCVYCIKCNKHITTLSSLRNNKQQRYPPTFFSDGVPCSIPVYMQYAHVLHFIQSFRRKDIKKFCFCFVLCGKRRKKFFFHVYSFQMPVLENSSYIEIPFITNYTTSFYRPTTTTTYAKYSCTTEFFGIC